MKVLVKFGADQAAMQIAFNLLSTDPLFIPGHNHPVARDLDARARKALAKQMTAMGLNIWHRHHHVCENFSPHKDATECTGDHFYHWGGLTGFVSLIEEGFYY